MTSPERVHALIRSSCSDGHYSESIVRGYRDEAVAEATCGRLNAWCVEHKAIRDGRYGLVAYVKQYYRPRLSEGAPVPPDDPEFHCGENGVEYYVTSFEVVDA